MARGWSTKSSGFGPVGCQSRNLSGVCHEGASPEAPIDLIALAQVPPCRMVDIRLPGKGDSNSHGTRPVHQIKWIWTSRLSIKNSLSVLLTVPPRLTRGTVTSTRRSAAHPPRCARCGAGAGCSAIKYQSLVCGEGPCERPHGVTAPRSEKISTGIPHLRENSSP